MSLFEFEISLADFVERYNQQPFELAEGRIIPLSPNVLGHQIVVKLLFRLLDRYLETEKVGEIFFETPFVLTDQPDWVKGSRTPDLMFFSKERWIEYLRQMSEAKGKPVVLVPNLAVEVVSPNDLYTEIDNKVDGYLADGVEVVWVIDPQRKKVIIHRSDSDQQTTLRENGILTDADLLPRFSVALKSLFD